MNKVVIIFVLLRLSSYFMLDLFEADKLNHSLDIRESLLEQVIDNQSDSTYFAEIMAVDR